MEDMFKKVMRSMLPESFKKLAKFYPVKSVIIQARWRQNHWPTIILQKYSTGMSGALERVLIHFRLWKVQLTQDIVKSVA